MSRTKPSLIAPSLTPRAFTLILFAASLLPGAHAQTSTRPNIPPAADKAYHEGLDAESRQQYDLALERLQTALKQAGNCSDCLEAMVPVQQAMGDDKGALATAAKLASSAGNPSTKARADLLAGRIYYEQYLSYSIGSGNYDKDPKRAQTALQRAEVALAHAAQEDPANEPVLMMHAHLLAMLKRDADARAAFAACAAVPGTSAAECARATRFSQNVDIARNEPAPPFTLTTMDGQKVSLDSLAGKIVLLDFWGTWCPVCRNDSSYVQSIQEKYHSDRFVLLEVDSGDTRERWLNYVKENHMDGVQTRDDNNQMQSLFRVSAFPTYVILDGDGTVRYRYRGAVGDLRADIGKLLNESNKASADPTLQKHP